jgi:iron-sulfur cluster assembly accessory protein
MINTGKLLRLVSTASRKNALTSRNLSVAVVKPVPFLFMDRTFEIPLHSFTTTTTSASRRSMSMVTKTRVEDMPSVAPQETGGSSAPVGDSSAAPDAGGLAATSTDGVLVTDSCWKRIRALASKKEKALDELYLRVYVDSGGCSGFSYAFEISEEELEKDDVVFSEPATLGSDAPDGLAARVVIDEGSLEMLRGSSIDFVQEMIRSSFTVTDNPLSESACGCGSSFAMKNFASNPALD